MYTLIDFKFEDFNTGIDVNFDKFYQVRNNQTGQIKWIDEYTFHKFQSLGLLE